MQRTTLMALAVLVGMAPATVFYVEPGEAIQAALDSCDTGDTVLVAPGTYVENLVWPDVQGIKLMSEFGPDSTIIDGDSAGSVIQCTTSVDTSTWIHGLTIRNGLSLPGTMGGGGLYCLSSSPRVAHNLFTENRTPRGDNGGGGILARDGSKPHIIENDFIQNTAGYGGAVCCYSAASPLILNNIITGNLGTTSSGGIEVVLGSAPVIRGNYIKGNRGPWGGGMAISMGSTPVVDSNFFRHDTADLGGAICCWLVDSVLITRNVIDSCVADSFGGGIFSEQNSRPTIRHCTITHCKAVTASDGGIGCTTGSAPDVDSCTITFNVPHGIVARTGALPTVNCCSIFGNAGYGVLHVTTGPDSIDAEHNWWGDNSGPYHPTLNPAGLGDTVSDYVDFVPWDTLVGIAEPVTPAEPAEWTASTVLRGIVSMPRGASAVLLDITGRRVMDLMPGENDIRHVSPGVYFLRAEDGTVTVREVIVTR